MPYDTLTTAVAALLGKETPRSMMIIGHLPEIQWEAVIPAITPPQVISLSASGIGDIAEHGTQDLVAVGGVLESVPRREGARLLAGLRDLHARKVLLRLVDNADWTHRDIVALGLTQLTAVESATGRVGFYGFDLRTYKTTPDWLNPKFWANPELFGRHRW